MIELLFRSWCSAFHGKPYRPMFGSYRCKKCMRVYAVTWNDPPVLIAKKPRPAEERRAEVLA